jgi:glycosyltransferase involved in cell wall biosynthesis
MQHVPHGTGLPIFLQEQNIEYLLWKQRAETARDSSEKSTATWEYLRTIEAETTAWQRADMCGAVTSEDLSVMHEALPSADVRLVPNGFDHLKTKAARPKEGFNGNGQTAVFVANFAYQPNIDAALYLGERIWPLVSRRVPEAQLRIVGNAPPPEVEALGSSASIEVTGRVPDVTPYVNQADVVLCPLRIGGGVKVKVLEALCLGKAIVTTTIGAQGFREPQQSMCLVDEPRRFALATIGLLKRPDLRADMEARARSAANQLPTWDDAAAVLDSCYRDLAGRPAIRQGGPAQPLGGALF